MTEVTTLPVATGASFDPTVKAAFDTGTDGRTKTTWDRAYQSPLGFGWDAVRGSPYSIGMGGRTQRESFRAANVAAELSTSNPIIATMIETLTTNALGTGLTLSSKPDVATLGISAEMGRAISHAFETGWRAWSMSPLECDASGRFDIHVQASCFFKTWLVSGEGLAALDWQSVRGAKTKTKVCLLDPRQIDSTVSISSDNGGSTVAGVVFDKRGRLSGYMIRDVPIAGLGTQSAKFVEAFTSWGRPRIIHAFEPIDAKQVRGLSPLVAALTPANERESLNEFGVVNALLQTQYALTVESDLPPAQIFGALNPHEPHGGGTMPGIAEYLTAREGFYGRSEIKMSPGVVNHLPPGDKLKMNKVENADSYEAFNRSLTMSAARAGGAMVEEVSGDYSKTSFSASRLAQELPFRLTQRRRKLILEKFYGDVFGAWLDEAIETRTVLLPNGAPDYWKFRDAYRACRWLGIGRAEPDRKKAAEADALELELGLATYEDALAGRGLDLETHLENIKSERVLMRDAGLDKPFFPGSVTTQNRREVIEEAVEDHDGEMDRNA